MRAPRLDGMEDGMQDTRELIECQGCGSKLYRLNVAFYVLADGREVCTFCASEGQGQGQGRPVNLADGTFYPTAECARAARRVR